MRKLSQPIQLIYLILIINLLFITPLWAYPDGWTNDLMISMKAKDAFHPSAVADSNGNVNVVWDDNGDDIYYCQIDESGSIVVSQKLITSFSAEDGNESNYPCITSDNKGDLWIFWQDKRSGVFEIYYARSTDNGRTWSRDLRFTAEDGNESTHPRASAKSYGDSGRVYVTWQDRRNGSAFEVYFRQISYSPTGALTMSSDTLATPSDNFESTQPDIISYRDWIYLVWSDMRDGNNEIYFKKSNDMGATWTGEIPVSDIDGFISQSPRIAANSSGIHIVWEDFKDNNFEVYYKALEHNLFTSNTIVNSKRLSTKDIYDSRYPSIAAEEKKIYIVWQDSGNSLSEEIAFTTSTDNGNKFLSPTKYSNGISRSPIVLTGDNSEGAKFPVIVTMNGNQHVIWSRKYSNNHDIFYKGTIVKLLSTSPAINSTGALLNSKIRMTFSKMMDANSIRNNLSVYSKEEKVQGNIQFLDYDSVSGTVSKIEFVPSQPLKYNSTYTIVVSKYAKDKNGYSIAGNAMGGFKGIDKDDFIWSFSTVKSAPGSPIRNVVNSPNPFNQAGTFFNYVIDPAGGTIGDTTIKIYSITGRLLRTLNNCSSLNGVNQQFFDGRDKSGVFLPNGVFLYRITTRINDDDCSARGKMIIMRDGCCR